MTASSLTGLAWLVPLLPGAASLALAFGGRRLPRQGDRLAVASVAASWLLAVAILFATYAGGRAAGTLEWAVFGSDTAGASRLTVGYRLDGLAALMLVVVTTVSLAVHVFSTGYMAGDARYQRYFAMLSFFTFAMLGLVVADNLLALFIFWELVGFASYALIGHYFERSDARSASMKAFMTTRVGDVAMLLGLFLIFRETGTFDFEAVREAVAAGRIPPTQVTLAALLLFGGAIGKSAQFPLHVWLPDAMAGPTPVSALIHAATMVAAGVYLVARSYGIFFGSADALQVVAWIGGFTALFATSAAHHVQHTNRLGGLFRKMPLTAAAWMVGGASLVGIPPFSGFFSKDEVLMAACSSATPALFWIGVAAAVLTGFYVTRATWLVFFGAPRDRAVADSVRESPPSMTVPLLGLAVPAAFGGLWNTSWLGYAFCRLVAFEGGVESAPSPAVSILAVGAGLVGVGVALGTHTRGWSLPRPVVTWLRPLYALLKRQYYVDDLYRWAFVQGTLALARLAAWTDEVVIDRVVNGVGPLVSAVAAGSAEADERVIDRGVTLASATPVAIGRQVRRLHTGLLQTYAMGLFGAVVAGLILILAW